MARPSLLLPVLVAVLVVASGVGAGAVEADRPLASGALLWAGQSVAFDASEVVDDVGNASAEERTFELRTVTPDGAVGSLVREVVVDAGGEAALGTDGLEGRYVLRYQGRVVYVQDGVGYTAAPPDGTAVTVGNSAWEVARQSLSASWSDDRVFRHDVVDLEVDSNRAAFQLEVSADGLDFDDLESMFDAGDFAVDHDAKAADDVLILEVQPPAALQVRFAALDNGRYELVLQVRDTAARTSTVVQVGRPPAPTPTATPAIVVSPTPVGSPTVTSTPSASPAPPSPAASPATETIPGTPTPAGTPTDAPTEGPTATPGQPGFGIALAVMALAVSLLAGRRLGGAGD